MFFFLLYCGTGIYLLLIVLGVLHKGLLDQQPQARPGDPVDEQGRPVLAPVSSTNPRRWGVTILGSGLIVLGLYYGFHAYFFSTPEGKRFQKLQREMQQRAIRGGLPQGSRLKGDAETRRSGR